MASTDIDGSVIVILSKDEASAIITLLRIVNCGRVGGGLLDIEYQVADKIARALSLEPLKRRSML